MGTWTGALLEPGPYLDRGLFVVLVLLDFTKAFDSVDHDL
jgi:hypothetical protein